MDGIELLDVVKQIEHAVATLRPTRLYTHHGGDVNVDHQILQRAVVTACRPLPGSCVREMFFFETPSSTEWSVDVADTFLPNCFVDIEDTLEIKLAALQAYAAEMRAFPHPRSMEAVTHLARWRGACAGFSSAEAFAVGRILMP
jgi:LmbE family N-acetylglucosaminyl deacetylase